MLVAEAQVSGQLDDDDDEQKRRCIHQSGRDVVNILNYSLASYDSCFCRSFLCNRGIFYGNVVCP